MEITNINKDIKLYDLRSGGQYVIEKYLQSVTDLMERREIKGPLFIIVFELTENALKAVYKKIFFSFFVTELGLDEVTYHDWLRLFRTEIEEHSAANFVNMAAEKEIGVDIYCRLNKRFLRIYIVNPGAPSQIEMDRIKRSIERAESITDLAEILEEDRDIDGMGEGANVGISLIFSSLRGIGGDEKSLRIFSRGDNTISRIKIPVPNLIKK